MVERRRAPRTAVEETATAVTPSLSAKCAINEISATGARLTFTHAMILPWKFTLRFEEDGHEESVQMIWRKGAVVGVSFLRPIQFAAAQQRAAPI